MNLVSKFLVSRKINGHFEKIDIGSLYAHDGSFHKPDYMTDDEHQRILNVVRWMTEETIKPNFVDMEGGYRVSLC